MSIVLQLLADAMGGVLIAAAISDMIRLRIPNYLPVALVVLFAAYAIADAMPLDAVLWHVIAGVIVLAVGMALFAFGLFGGGDIKLLAAVALLIGWSSLLPLVVMVAVIGGLLAIVIATMRARGVTHFLGSLGVRGAIFESDRAYVPYAVAIAAGWFLVGPFHLI
jgi:prepilin peptidase CpaA